jgi:ATP-binding cassette, subfamily B, multidrug efflux pump
LKSLLHLNSYLLRYKWHVGGGLLFIIASNAFALYPAQITRTTIDYLHNAVNLYNTVNHPLMKDFVETAYARLFLLMFGLIIGATILKGLLMFFMRQTIIVMSRHIEYDLKNDIYAHYQKLSQQIFKTNRTGDLMSRISEDVGQVRMYLGPAIMYTLNLIVLFAMVITTMFSINATLSLMSLLPLPFLSYGIYKVSSIINRKSTKIQQQLGVLNSFAQSTFSGIRIIKSYSRENIIEKKLEDESLQYKSFTTDLLKTESLFGPLVTLLIGASNLLTIFVGGLLYMKGEVSLGNIAEFILYVNMLTWPVFSLGWVSSVIQKAAVSQQRINEFLNLKAEIESGSFRPEKLKGKIEFRNVSFTYPESGIKAIQDISFCLVPGESLAITGKTGSGKSTILSLMARLYDPDEGEILVDDVPLKQYDLQWLRNQMGIVQQDVFLFSETIQHNIAFGLKTHYTKADVIDAANDSAILESIENFPEGFETVLGERGITLSGGQKQRISLARAFIKNPALLVLDDCLSAVDTQTESRIISSIKKRMNGKSSILISHRISTINFVSNILVLDDGRIVEQGTHEQLLSSGGTYAELFNKQVSETREQV